MRLRLFFKKKKIFFILKKSRKNFKNRFSQSRFGSIKELYVILKNFKMFRQSVYSRLANLYAFNKITSMSVCFIIFFLKNPSKFFFRKKLNFAFPLRFITKLKFFLGARYLNFFHNLLINSKRITGSSLSKNGLAKKILFKRESFKKR